MSLFVIKTSITLNDSILVFLGVYEFIVSGKLVIDPRNEISIWVLIAILQFIALHFLLVVAVAIED